ncbi:WD repeat-containing protein 44-like [Clytia hemisphaerica]|uniref:WD repeat-containing protein 44 n=1 Tax=Clytia hemisphaerica TaxID=252671 RepID=A0A7M5URX5_9CNID
MDSASDDEFFDAEEELSPKKVVKALSTEQEITSNVTPIDVVDGEAPQRPSKTKINKDIITKTENIDITQEDMIIKDAEITRLQEFSNSSSSDSLSTVASKDELKNTESVDEVESQDIKDINEPEKLVVELPPTDIPEEDLVTPIPSNPSVNKLPEIIETPPDSSTSINIEKPQPKRPSPPKLPPQPTLSKPEIRIEDQDEKCETEKDDKSQTVSPNQPVAPPRKRRQKKGDTEGKDKPSRPPPPRPPPPAKVVTLTDAPSVPFIKVSTSTTEMNKILVSGNSLEVVYNDDQMARRSGGILSPPPKSESPTSTTKSSAPLTDAEILEQVIIKNLDTGEAIPLSLAEDRLPKCTNPLALHIFRLATEEDDEENEEVDAGGYDDGHLSDTSTTSSIKAGEGKRKRLKKFLGKTVEKIKLVADEVTRQGRPNESSSEDEDQHDDQHEGAIKFKNHRAIKDRLMFRKIKLLQDLSGEHIGAVWTMKFSLCGKLLATAGQDNIVRVWVLKESAAHFQEMKMKYSKPTGRSSPTGSMTSHTSTASADDDPVIEDLMMAHADDDSNNSGPFKRTPFVSYHGHTSDVLDLSWSKNYFLLSSSMDKTVRLWHISRNECLCCFQHVDFVTAICFHPRDDRYFLSGSLDGKIRLWNIPEKKVALWNEIDGSGTSLITAANFCQDGKLAVVGTYDGRCIFYDTERLKYHTQVTVRSSRGKNARGRKISGIEPMPNEDKVLITSNDSRIRLYDLKDHSLYCKYKGLQNESSQIRASFSNDGKLILCGSEDKFVHIWRTNHDVPNARKDRNEYYESFSAHDAVVTAAIFAPFPNVIMEQSTNNDDSPATPLACAPPSEKTPAKEPSNKRFEVLVAADWQGGVKFFINR